VKPLFFGTVKHGKLILDDKDRFDQYLLTLEGETQVVVGRRKKSRSTPQNKYYWGVCIRLLSEETGYNKNETHDALRMLFLMDHSKGIPTIRSTASLTTVQFEDYLSKIRMWASQELSCYIPEPNEVEY